MSENTYTPVPPPGRENFTRQGLQAWLDSPAGRMLTAVHGSRQAAAAALAEDDQAALDWRQERAEHLRELYPGRYASVADAKAEVADPVGGSGAWFAGSADDLQRASRRADVTRPIRNLGEALADGSDTVVLGPGMLPADVRPPWARD